MVYVNKFRKQSYWLFYYFFSLCVFLLTNLTLEEEGETVKTETTLLGFIKFDVKLVYYYA